MKITVTKDNVKIEEFDIVHEGEHRVNKCSFSFSEEYTEDLVKKAIFTSQNSSVEVAIINNECDIPTEILRARNIVLLGVYAYKVVDDKLDLRYSPSPDAFKVNSGSYIEGANKSEEITSSQFEQYMQALNNGLNKVEEALKEMDSVTSAANNLVNDINQKLENGDFIGPQGPQGIQGIPGKDGINGADGVGITTITSGQSTVEEDKTITPVTVNKTDGSSQSFKVEAKNGLDGQNGQDGQDGLTPTIGDNGNWFIGDTDTGKPSRGEIGPSPDLSDYVKNTDYANTSKAGVFKPTRNLYVNPETGYVYAQPVSKEEYNSSEDTIFMAKGTIENIKDDYIGSSIPVKNLNNSLRDLTPKQDIEGTDNTFDDGIESKLYALSGDGKSEQVVTTGKAIVDLNSLTEKTINGITFTPVFKNGLLEYINVNGTSTAICWYIMASVTLEENQVYSFLANSTDENVRFFTNTSDYVTTKVENKTNSQTSEQNISINVDTGKTINNARIYPMIAKSTTIEEYEPYTGLKPSPNPDYEQPINSIEGSLEFACNGKNLLNLEPNNVAGVTIIKNDDGSFYVNGTINNTWINITKATNDSLELNKNYCFSIDHVVNHNVQLRFNYEDKSYQNFIITSGKQSVTFSLSKKAINYYIYFYKAYGLGSIDDTIKFQLEVGTEPTSYEPYVEPNKVTFNLGEEKLRSVGDVKDELVVDLDTGDYYKQENIGEIVFDGSEDEGWEKYASVRDTKLFDYSFNIRGNIENIELINFNYVQNGMCNMSKMGLYSARLIHECEKEGIEFGANHIYFAYEKFSNYTLEEFKEWLNSHNIIANYILATPTTKKLGTLSAEDLAKLKTFKGYNNVTVNTNLGLMNIRFTYGLDIKKYVDNKIAELSAQLIRGE